MVHRLRLFQLGNYGNVALVRRDNLLDGQYVGSSAHEGERNCIDAVIQSEFEIFAVFCR